MVRLIGIDLAWTAHRESGICAVEGDGEDWRLVTLGAGVCTAPSLVYLCGAPAAVAAIDAPLIVGPGRGAERALGTRFSRFKAPAHSANLELLTKTYRDAGPRLAAALARQGWELDPLPDSRPRRWAVEVYPHSCHVSWFGRPARIRYKRKKGMQTPDVRAGLGELQGHLAPLLQAELPSLAEDPRLAGLLSTDPVTLRGRQLKLLEDQLDAVTCLIAAYYAWRDGIAPCEVFGNGAGGYIAVPGLHRDPREELHPLGCVHPHQAQSPRQRHLSREHQAQSSSS